MSQAREVMIHLDFESLDEGGFVATSPDVPGLVAQGRTVAEAIEIARDVARKIVESCIEHDASLPPSSGGICPDRFRRMYQLPFPKSYGWTTRRPEPS